MFRDIHTKSKTVRDQYAFWGAAGVTAVIALLWVVSLEYRFDDVDVDEERGAVATFFTDLRQNAAAIFSSVEEASNVPAEGEAAATSTATSSRPIFELTPRTAPSSEAGSSGRSIRVEPASERASSTPVAD